MIVKEAVEVRLQQVRFNLAAHLPVSCQVKLLNLSSVDALKHFWLAGRV